MVFKTAVPKLIHFLAGVVWQWYHASRVRFSDENFAHGQKGTRRPYVHFRAMSMVSLWSIGNRVKCQSNLITEPDAFAHDLLLVYLQRSSSSETAPSRTIDERRDLH